MQLRDFFRHYKGSPYQDAAIQQLQEAIPADVLRNDAAWFKTWQASGKQAIPNPLGVKASES